MTGLELLQQLIDQITSLKQEVGLINSNLIVLNNRIARMVLEKEKAPSVIAPVISPPPPQPTSKIMTAISPQQEKQKSVVATEKKSIPTITTNSSNFSYKRVYGSCKDSNGNSLPDVVIMFYDQNSNNEVCASALTDSLGQWDTMLKSGNYTANFIKNNGLINTKVFSFDSDTNEFELT